MLRLVETPVVGAADLEQALDRQAVSRKRFPAAVQTRGKLVVATEAGVGLAGGTGVPDLHAGTAVRFGPALVGCVQRPDTCTITDKTVFRETHPTTAFCGGRRRGQCQAATVVWPAVFCTAFRTGPSCSCTAEVVTQRGVVIAGGLTVAPLLTVEPGTGSLTAAGSREAKSGAAVGRVAGTGKGARQPTEVLKQN